MGKGAIVAFKRKHANSEKALDRWMKLIGEAEFKNPQGMKQVFGNKVDFISRQTVFNIGGNKFRLIAKVSFETVLVTHILTHKEYMNK